MAVAAGTPSGPPRAATAVTGAIRNAANATGTKPNQCSDSDGYFVLVPALSRDRSKLRDAERSGISGAALRKRHSASKTRVNALMALHRIRDTSARDGKPASDAL
jgi:hypothetical protein